MQLRTYCLNRGEVTTGLVYVRSSSCVLDIMVIRQAVSMPQHPLTVQENPMASSFFYNNFMILYHVSA